MVSDFPRNTYLDFAASTPIDPRVLAAMLPYFQEGFGNASSTHSFGQQAEAAIEKGRATVAQLLNCLPEEVVFTSGGTESDNLALQGVALAMQAETGANHILISPVEHPAVSNTAKYLAKHHGCEVEFLPVDEYGQVDPASVQSRLKSSTALVSVIMANNEIGTINPIAEIATACQAAGVLFHSDAVQAAAYLPLDFEAVGVDLLSLGGHKLYGPKGVGALILRKGTRIEPLFSGGSQESGLRPGTSNTPLIAGFAEALKIAVTERDRHAQHLQILRDQLLSTIPVAIPDTRITGHPHERLANHASFAFHGVNGNDLLMLLSEEGFACSSGSACKTGNPEPSDTLLALGLATDWAFGSLRVTLGRGTTQAEIDAFLAILPQSVARCRQLEQIP